MNENLLESKDSGNKLFEGTNPLKDSRTGCFGRALFSWATPLVRVPLTIILFYLCDIFSMQKITYCIWTTLVNWEMRIQSKDQLLGSKTVGLSINLKLRQANMLC